MSVFSVHFKKRKKKLEKKKKSIKKLGKWEKSRGHANGCCHRHSVESFAHEKTVNRKPSRELNSCVNFFQVACVTNERNTF